MLFNSLTFVVFFLLVYSLYLLLLKHYRAQNIFLLVASYIFYGSWNWRFLILLIISTVVDFFVSQWMSQTSNLQRRKLLLTVSLLTNLSILGFFKYFNFFVESFIQLFNWLGIAANPITLNIILPVGISFYTFQTLSYTIDVYRGKLIPAKNLLDFAVYVAFFPQLVAGPIERAENFLPQITHPRKVKLAQINAGLFLILWGYFKKVVIADNIGLIANAVFNNYTDYQGIDVIIGILAFTVQIYGDFSGYSDIARGISKLMGFELMVNFKLPFFAINPSDFWARWHISLSTWLRDYLYIPLGGNRQGTFNTYRNLGITMLLGGLWHGAAWNFVIWGAYHGLILIIYRMVSREREHLDPWGGKYSYPSILAKMLLMFILANIGWVIFRCTSLEQMGYILTHIGLSWSENTADFLTNFLWLTVPLLIVQIHQYFTGDLLALIKLNLWLRVPIYSLFLVSILLYGYRESVEFIYFQF
ncbi:MBOAT family O-acyltransferase [Oscillatoria salina]|uniref:MBOAT family O-acyltransferase n=1 Tax=Oscillatoria salina TaxID=331517 RepID=UPI0013B5EC52|nr:MBOAT family O-acyltransferase [Oscillatoria salina]MBZ8182074.1 MBOAT family protein [Oscillatoria salina IIICB1]NET87269.1 MBOAT family protein [Kamptonema sp. SIO1D9]